jgi:hypothetical protein
VFIGDTTWSRRRLPINDNRVTSPLKNAEP